MYSFFNGTDARVAVAVHGSFSALPPVLTDEISPYLLVLSGGDDGLHGNQTIMEDAFNSGNADWEITRYAGVGKFSLWHEALSNVLSLGSSVDECFALPLTLPDLLYFNPSL